MSAPARERRRRRPATEDKVRQVKELAQQLRVDAVRASAAAGSGHPTSGMSAADLMAVLFSNHLRYDFSAPENRANDHLVFSKGHASPLLYALYKAAGAIDDEELLTFREFGSRLQGHPTPELPWVDVATGSLGQGLPIAVGIALAARLESSDLRVWTLCGDSEMAEGSMWEAFEHAGYNRLSNLIAIVDVNRLGQRGPTMHEWDTSKLAARAAACDWHVQEIDGHDFEAIEAAYAEALASDLPAAIFARTKKGSGVSAVEDQPGWHGKPLADPEAAIEELGGLREASVTVQSPPEPRPFEIERTAVERPAYELGEKVATRGAYGDALAWLGSIDEKVVALDGEVGNSTYAERFAAKHPDRFFEMYIAEQQMVASAIGLQTRGWKPFASSFGAFLSRAYDFVRMGAISDADLKLCGSHVGVSIGADGPSQMALEDIASLRAVLGSVVLYPSDPNQTVVLLDAMREHRGVSYMRTTREKTPVIYAPDEDFRIGGSRTLRSGEDDALTLIGAGITLHECLTAAEDLAEKGIAVRVIDLYSVKPVDAAAILAAAAETQAIVTVEDHWAEGGIGDVVAAVLAENGVGTSLTRLAVSERPGSGPPEALLAAAGIDAPHIVSAAEKALETSAAASNY
ncbi:MAG TPA: transketolase [Solirubrobacterales bacterium]|nr:transketolase [Solirubrobacterales bacterium]